jgi:hypothetical protein
MKNSKNMPKKSSSSIEYEETYDNFDPKKDTDEWSQMIKERNKNLTNTKYKSKASNSNCCLKTFERIFNSHSFHAIILVLIVLECFFVAGEFIVNYIQTNLSKDHSEQINKDILLSKQSDIEMINHNSTKGSILNPGNFEQESVKILQVLELVCKYGGFIVLLIFVFEILVKITLVPKNICKFFEIFDVVIVFIAFSLNLYLLIKEIPIHQLSGMLVILR